MSNRENSAIAHLAVDCIGDISRLAILAREYDTTSVASAALLDILSRIRKFTKASMEA